MEKETLRLVLTIFFLIGIIAVMVVVAIRNPVTTEKEYYKLQTKHLCEIANQYRGLALLENPDLITQVPEPLDCNKIVEPLK